MWFVWLGVAHAFEMGTSVGIGGEGLSFPPSLDLYFEPVVLQIHALGTLDAAFDESLYLGANLYVDVAQQPIGGNVVGVVQPGLSLDIWGDPDSIAIAAESRFGAQLHETAGVGLYVVPALGLVSSGGRAELFAGGGLQISVWYGL